MDPMHQALLGHFPLDGNPLQCDRYGCGHINETYLVVTDCEHRYILQKINHHIFKDVPGLMENIAAVTGFLRASQADPRKVLTLVNTLSGDTYLFQDGSYWRLYEFVEDSICLQLPKAPEDFYQSALAFGGFMQQLKDFPADKLHETIPNFHNTIDRYRIFHETLRKDPLGRAKDVSSEIRFLLAREEEAGTLVRLLNAQELPLRVTHNDTKLNNVMLDAATGMPLCVIDLDTVMPGLSAYDFGDSIRFGAATALEDETDLTKMEMDLNLFRIYTRGFLKAFPDLTALEKQMLPMGAKLMTLEVGLRFLTDYIDGDHYFAIHRPGHNLDRSRTQLKLVADMEEKWDAMHRIVQEEDISHQPL